MADARSLTELLDDISRQVDRARDQLRQLNAAGWPGSPRAAAPGTDLYVPPVTAGGFEIVGVVATNDFPYCCAIGGDTGWFCTGTLIAPNVVVTARHCTDCTRVFLKGSDVSRPREGEIIPISRQFEHPTRDLRVLVLRRKSRVKPRHVAQGREVYRASSVRVAGFGTVNLSGTVGYGIKRMADVPLIVLNCTSAACRREYGAEPGELVAGHLGLQRDTCRGDSGGPLYIRRRGGDGYYLLGATSRGTDNAQHVCGDGGIYTRVDLVLDWAREVTGVRIEGARS
jgi:hypothetical protein